MIDLKSKDRVYDKELTDTVSALWVDMVNRQEKCKNGYPEEFCTWGEAIDLVEKYFKLTP